MVTADKFSDSVFKAKTGKTPKEWNAVLNRFGARRKGHTAAAKFIREKFKQSGWWAQTIVVRWEYDNGLEKKKSYKTYGKSGKMKK